ncbi:MULTISPECIES: succinate dehydrogenase assembly factor 2 [Ramlibacter]|jgi:antitoxin CptB|uniref:FAD assembly factor SdhE n=1 Tax=Ramlibacter pinisoli TaxID=2682844 RepID=A0A6N8ISL7_9BURK|nr:MULTISPECIES: succinate dehydrogenase assembly factor 2 [Ramlibacter]MBA2964120.1 succinate dehydrogenase assembly factor 2 [Ramlibacter sp. CGMCC 1.13660]MVQ29086.1 succinate dehydrogenase assembly factor 2 [Ramlibacter pinisoli]
MPTAATLDDHAVGKLRWRCRRGLLENDLFLERFFARHGDRLTAHQGIVLEELMQLADNDLMDLFLRRREPAGELDRPDVKELLEQLRGR